MYCKKCGEKLEKDSKFCSHCGSKVEIEIKKVYCTHCGEKIEYNLDVCPFCSKKVFNGYSSENDTESLILQIFSFLIPPGLPSQTQTDFLTVRQRHGTGLRPLIPPSCLWKRPQSGIRL